MSNMYACVGVPICTLFIVLSDLSILTKHTLTFQYNNSTIISYIKVPQSSEYSLWQMKVLLQRISCFAVATTKLTTMTNFNIWVSLTWAYSLQRKTILAPASALYPSQPKHKTQNTIHYSQSEPARCSENHTRCSEWSQFPATLARNPNTF